MGSLQSTVVVVPCFDEAERLQRLELLRALDEWPWLSFVLVDDGSRDRTLEVLRALSAERPGRVRVVALEKNRGKAEAVRRGVLEATSLSPWAFGYWDADLATPLAELPRLHEALARPGTLVALGSRVRLLGRAIERRPQRHYLGRVYATFVGLMLGLEVYDTQCGAKLFRNTRETRGIFQQPFATRWSFDVELLLRLLERAKRGDIPPMSTVCQEVPLQRWVDVAGSKLGLSSAPRVVGELFAIGASAARTRFRR